MNNKLEIAISAIGILVVASTAPAKDGGLPKLDIEYACHAAEKAVSAIFSVTSDIFASCMSDENEARKQLEKDWARTLLPIKLGVFSQRNIHPAMWSGSRALRWIGT